MAVLVVNGILQFPLNLKQCSDATIAFTVVDDAGQPITNPTGWSARAQIRSVQGSPVLFEWNTTPGPGLGTATLTYDSGNNTSTLTLTLTETQSATFTWSSAQYDCFLTNPTGQPACIAEGTVAIDPAITQ